MYRFAWQQYNNKNFLPALRADCLKQITGLEENYGYFSEKKMSIS